MSLYPLTVTLNKKFLNKDLQDARTPIRPMQETLRYYFKRFITFHGRTRSDHFQIHAGRVVCNESCTMIVEEQFEHLLLK